MLRLAFLASSLFLVGCAAPRTSALLVGEPTDVAANPARAGAMDSLPETRRALETPAVFALTGLTAEPAPTVLALEPQEGESLHGSRFTVKGGYYGAEEDAIDDGYIFGVSWMNFMSKILALEFELGYVDADGSDGGVDAEVWSLPIMVNGRVNVPIWVLDVYGGLGVGTFYYDAEVSGGGSDDGFLLGGNAFLGSSINVADRIALGLEAKYYLSEEIDDFDGGLDAFALMLTLGFSR